MRSIRVATVTAALLVLAAAVPLAAATKPRRAATPVCEEVLAKGDTTWIAEKAIEVGQVAGLLNGGFYLSYADGAGGSDPIASKPQLVITTKAGDLRLAIYGESVQQEDGTWSRTLGATSAVGTGAYRDATVKLGISGVFYPDKGGSYELAGTICTTVPSQLRR
jgi:hypothetical protein